MRKILEKIRWGVLSWIFGILVFYLTAGIIGAQFVFVQINGQTGQIATIFDSWWQVLMFVADLIFGLLFAISLGLYIWKMITLRGNSNEKVDA